MSDLLEIDPDFEKALPLDPFGSHPQWSSRVHGLGGHEPPPDPSYAFLTLDSRPALGKVSVKVRFFDLAATRGTLLVEIRVRSAFPGAEPTLLQTIAVNLNDLVTSGGVVELSFESYRNAYYAIAGSINDETDISASHISITIDRRATSAEHNKEWGWRAAEGMSAKRRSDIESALISGSMTELAKPGLDEPMSQVGGPLQCREQGFFEAMEVLGRDPVPTFENWSLAYVIRAVGRFTDTHHRSKMLGYVANEAPLLSYFAARECEIIGMRHAAKGDEQVDPGRELQRLWMPDLCSEEDFFSHAHFTIGDIRLPPANFRDQFDVIWSIGANRVMTPQEFIYFAVNSLANVKPGGLAVHVFDYAEGAEADQASNLTRRDVERLAALALAHRNDVARLQFRHGTSPPPSGSILPFGLTLLRGELPGS